MGQENKPKKSLWSKMGNWIYEETSDNSENTEKVEETANVNAGVNQSSGNFNYSQVQNNSAVPGNLGIMNANGIFDEKFYNGFLKVLEDNNLDGVDYFEFSRAKKANDNLPGFTEAMKYQSAFNTLKTISPTITKEHLLKTADFYIEKLGSEEQEFSAEMQNEVNNQVTARLDLAKQKEKAIADKQAQILALQNEIVGLQTEIGQVNLEAQQKQAQIDTTAKNFKVTIDVVKAQINQDKANIQNFIQ